MEATHGDSCGARSQIPAEEHPHTYALAPPGHGYSRRTVDELGALMRDGDEHAWAELYAALKTDLRWYAYRLTGNEAEADDLVQDTLVRAWEKRGDYDQACPYRPWIFTILKNLGRSGQRKDAGHIRRLDRTSPVEVLERCHGSMEADPAVRESSAMAILQLPTELPDIEAALKELASTHPARAEQILQLLLPGADSAGVEPKNVIAAETIDRHLRNDWEDTIASLFFAVGDSMGGVLRRILVDRRPLARE